ncbi:substrate-binding domain-containing protein [Botrimarina colliarenosi]|nr:substrate-binding domain-containing protein [Botrimarina colliarenosi]
MFSSKAFWALTTIAIAAVLLYRSTVEWTDPKRPSPESIAFITGGEGPYWQAAIDGATAAADERGIRLVVHQPKNSEDVAEQMQILSVVSSSDVGAVAISPVEPERQAPLITQIGVTKPIVTFDSDAAKSGRHGYIGTSNFSAGLVAGTLVKSAIPEGGEIAVLMANKTKENLIERQGGIRTRIAESPNPEESPTDRRYKILGFFTDEGDDAACEKQIRDLVDGHPDLACVVTLNSRQGPVVMRTLEDLGATERVKLIAFDTSDAILDGIEAGTVYAAVAQDPYKYGYEAISMLDSLCRGDERQLPMVGRGAVHFSVEPLRQGDVEAFRKRTESRHPVSKG